MSNQLLACKRQLTDEEQGHLASMLKGAGYLSVLEMLISFAMADANGANEELTLGDDEMVSLWHFSEDLNHLIQDHG